MDISSAIINSQNIGRLRNGASLTLERTDPRHIAPRERYGSPHAAESATQSFSEMLVSGLQNVSDNQLSHQQLAVQGVIDPESVDVHDITIAATQADLSIQIARNIIDRTLGAYREIISLR